MSSPAPSPRVAPPTHRPPQQHIETIVIDDSDSEPEPIVVQSSRPRDRSGNADKNVHLPGPGQRGQEPTPVHSSSTRHATITSGSAELSERAKAKSRALDPPLSDSASLNKLFASFKERKAAVPPPYRADPDAEPIERALLSTYNCPICLCPPVNATITPCGHLFCGRCLFDALLTQTKKKQEEEAERRIFLMTNSPSFVLPRFLPPSGQARTALERDLIAFDSQRTSVYQAMVNAATTMADQLDRLHGVTNAGMMSNASSSGSTGSTEGRNLWSHSRRLAEAQDGNAAGAPRSVSSAAASTPVSASAIPARHQSSSSSSRSASASSSSSVVHNNQSSNAVPQSAADSSQAAQSVAASQASYIDGALAAAQNAYNRLPPLASIFNHAAAAHTSSSFSPTHWGSDIPRGLTRSASPAASSLASSSAGSSGSSTTSSSTGPSRLSRPHPGMTAQQGVELLRSMSPSARARSVHNLAGTCPLCRGEIPKGFNVNMRTLPDRSKYFHKAGNPRRSVKNISPCKGKVMGLRLTFGRPADDPHSVNLERRKKRTFTEMEDDSETPVVIQASTPPAVA